MQDYRLKLVLTILSSILFAFIFVLLAFVSPIKKDSVKYTSQPKTTLEKISHAAKQ